MQKHLKWLVDVAALTGAALAGLACAPKHHTYSEFYDQSPNGLELKGESIDILIRRSTVSVSPRVRALMGWNSPSGGPTAEDLMLGYACGLLTERLSHYARTDQVSCEVGREPPIRYQPVGDLAASFLQQAWPLPKADERLAGAGSGARYTVIVDALTLATPSDVVQVDTQEIGVKYGMMSASRRRITVSRRLEFSLSARFVIWDNKSRSASALGRVELSSRLDTDKRWDAVYWLFAKFALQLLSMPEGGQDPSTVHDYTANARDKR